MKNSRVAFVALLALVVLAWFAPCARAESSTVPGATLTDEARKDRDKEYQHTDVINGVTAPGNALVSSAKLTMGWSWIGVHVYLAEASHGDSCAVAFMAVQVRAAYVAATDTMVSAPLIEPRAATTYGVVDTIGTARYAAGVASDVTGLPTSTLMPGEKLIPINFADGKRSAYFVFPVFRSRYAIVRMRTVGCAGQTSLATTTAVSQWVRVDLQGGR